MKHFLAAAFVLLAPSLALAAAPAPLGPNGGKFGDWKAATYGNGSAKICYAFTNAQISKPNWKSRGKVMLTVTNRSGSHDEVSISAGYTYPKNAKVTLAVGTKSFDFYTQADTAFTASGKDAVAAFAAGNSAAATGPGPKDHPVTDQFSLTGFSSAYKAIGTACP